MQQITFDNRTLSVETPYNELRSLMRKYPYFAAPRLLYLQKAYADNRVLYHQELEEMAIFASSRKLLFDTTQARSSAWYGVIEALDKLPDVSTGRMETLSLIDSFISLYAKEAPLSNELDIEANVYSAINYAATLDNLPTLDEAKPLAHEEAIDRFVANANRIEQDINPTSNEEEEILDEEEEIIAPEAPLEESSLSESLARIYIKERQYYKAFEIIQKLSLKYPEKNCYFADQLRFLEKLITNTKKD